MEGWNLGGKTEPEHLDGGDRRHWWLKVRLGKREASCMKEP